ncbi:MULTISPECIES: tol-pal system protein YbgF [Hymenobacter]|uniref:Tol-pal system protein YbgF n=1 Tax=Hymenobacter jejuensis TaxID=2502781 RepID=A0A5B7ZW13_9BACT|nr:MULTISPECIES: tol-pal system protein YbgF [Hymenobacter]MBC6988310.1 tol-pal system protein YbgF [Hymenobacter sp. BT491]QDA59331.1 tol-pal system protein YbgF [Hymenobacter jejuensis]
MTLKLRFVLLLALMPFLTMAQGTDTARKAPAPMRHIDVDNVDILPSAVDTKGWLLLDKDIQLELEGAVQNLYNFKYDKAEKQFRSLRRRYPQHPMPYFLLGLSTWWKIVPTNVQTKQYDKIFFAYMDTAITKGEQLYKRDNKNYEACFFLSAAYGFDARLNAERKNWRKATVSSKRALEYLQISQEANGLSPEFLFGQALFNYYAVWISETYPLLRPVLLFFPKGNRELGLQQLRNVANNGFYTGLEAKFFLMKILNNEEEDSKAAMPISRYLATNYPDNGYFQRFYALLCFNEGEHRECERVSREILDKINRGMPGYEAISGKYATYFLGWLMEYRYKDIEKAKDYYQRCIVFAESTSETTGGFYLYANRELARIADQQEDPKTAIRYYKEVLDKADRKSESFREAKAYIKAHKK